MYRNVYELRLSSGQIIALDKGVPMVNAFVIGNLCEYRHKSYTAKSKLFELHFVAKIWVSSTILT